jgi:hypothetical protein
MLAAAVVDEGDQAGQLPGRDVALHRVVDATEAHRRKPTIVYQWWNLDSF